MGAFFDVGETGYDGLHMLKKYSVICKPIALITGVVFTASTLVAPLSAFAAATHITSDATAWNIRIDGATEGDWTGYSDPVIADLDGNGRNDILLQSWWDDNNGRSNSGSLHVLFDSLLDDYTGTGNTIDLFASTSYNIRFDGAAADDYFSISGAKVADVDGDDAPDLLVAGYGVDPNGRSSAGALYLIDSSIFSGLTGTGNTVDMSASSSYTIRFEGAAANDMLAFTQGLAVADLDGVGGNDLLIGARDADNNGRTYSGSIYIFYDSLLDDYVGTGNTVDLASTTLFNIRLDGSESTELFGNGPLIIEDFDGNDTLDLMLPAYGRDNVEADGGSVYFIRNELLDAYAGVGNIVDLNASSTVSTRYDMISRHAVFGGSIAAGDFDDDGATDILVGANGADHGGNTVRGTGWTYLINNDLIDDYVGTDNVVELGTSSPTTNYNLRFIGASLTQHLGTSLTVADMDRDGVDDFFISGRFPEGETNESLGAVYYIDNDSFASTTGTGNDITITDADAYAARWEGISGSFFAQGMTAGDLNNDGRPDIAMVAYAADVSGRTDAGSTFIVFNFPHTVAPTVASAETDITSYDLTGTADASNSASDIAGVEYAFSSNPDGTWTACDAGDGAYNETNEAFICSLSGLAEGSYTIYLRAYDENGWYTDQSDYGSQALIVNFTPDEEEEEEDDGGGGGGGGGSSRRAEEVTGPLDVTDISALSPEDRARMIEEIKTALIALIMQLIEELQKQIAALS
ncbi:MAG: hypothetical protein AMXMBFR44_2220 [Candidatus Campbellbacteria bacterium]